jgi:hypothetical protein
MAIDVGVLRHKISVWGNKLIIDAELGEHMVSAVVGESGT